MTLVIMAAGMGSRYGGLKQIDPITPNGEFIIDFSVYDAINAGFDKIVFVIKEENLEIFRSTIGKRIERKIHVEYAFQSLDRETGGFAVPAGRVKPWGTGHAVLCAADYIDGAFAVINSDDFYGRDAFVKIGAFLSADNPFCSEPEKMHFCMVGYRLGNTLTDYGTVSRGVCQIDAQSILTGLVERTNIERTADGAQYIDENGTTPISLDTIVSMNCWGFPHAFLPALKESFLHFLNEEITDPHKSEFYLPYAVEAMIRCKRCDVTVLNTDAMWHGVTYAEDKPHVCAAIQEMTQNHVYPGGLWL